MESIVGDHPANGLDGTAMVITILAVNGSDAMDEGHMALSAPAVVWDCSAKMIGKIRMAK
jgi:hypothetical protein